MDSHLLNHLIETLQDKEIRFCSWKSNFYPELLLDEARDLDLLVDRKDVERFESVLASFGFKRVIDPLQISFPSVFHFFGFEEQSGELIHLHVYYQVITGESIIKNYKLPLEKLLLQNLRLLQGLPAAQAPAELLIFVVRAMAKLDSPLEYLLLQSRQSSGYEALRVELESLLVEDNAERCAELLPVWLPSVDKSLFFECINALRMNVRPTRRHLLAMRLRGQLKSYERFSAPGALFLQSVTVLKKIVRRVMGGGKSKQFASGGAVIAFVGPEATGKSTLAKETVSWLGQVFDVSSAHLGKPPSTWLTFIPNLTLPLARRVASPHRTSQVENKLEQQDAGRVSLLYAFRAVLLAWDRRALAVQVHRKAANGGIVICDRYPSVTVGAMDSARLNIPSKRNWRDKLIGLLARWEQNFYRQIPPPDLVIQLAVPVEVAIERNRERQKQGKESDAYVLRRHTTGLVPSFPRSSVVQLDSNQSQSQTIRTARQIMWSVL